MENRIDVGIVLQKNLCLIVSRDMVLSSPIIRIRMLLSYPKQACAIECNDIRLFWLARFPEKCRQATRNDSDTFPDFSNSICTSSPL